MAEKKPQGVAGIVLAAGMSTRMGTLKQLLPLRDKTVIEGVVEQVRGRLEQVVVVLGHRAEEVARALAGQAVECVFNPDYRHGMLKSVQCGLRAAPQAQRYLICLGDQPHIAKAADALLEAARRSPRGILIPTSAGRRGHPILISRSYLPEILSLPPDQGLNAVTRGHPRDTLEIPVEGEEVLQDMDTPADYQRELRRDSGRGERHG